MPARMHPSRPYFLDGQDCLQFLLGAPCGFQQEHQGHILQAEMPSRKTAAFRERSLQVPGHKELFFREWTAYKMSAQQTQGKLKPVIETRAARATPAPPILRTRIRRVGLFEIHRNSNVRPACARTFPASSVTYRAIR